MSENNEYKPVIEKLYSKSFILESRSDMHPVLFFYLMDSIAHIDYSLCNLTYTYQSVRNAMNMEYMRHRIDLEKEGDNKKFPAFINWLKEEHREEFDALPELWRVIYDKKKPASYRSYRIVIDPDSNLPTPVEFFSKCVDEFFDLKFIRSIYKDAVLGRLFDEFAAQN